MQVSIKRYIDTESSHFNEVATVYPNIREDIAEGIIKRLNIQAGHKYIDDHSFIPLEGKAYYMIDP